MMISSSFYSPWVVGVVLFAVFLNSGGCGESINWCGDVADRLMSVGEFSRCVNDESLSSSCGKVTCYDSKGGELLVVGDCWVGVGGGVEVEKNKVTRVVGTNKLWVVTRDDGSVMMILRGGGCSTSSAVLCPDDESAAARWLLVKNKTLNKVCDGRGGRGRRSPGGGMGLLRSKKTDLEHLHTSQLQSKTIGSECDSVFECGPGMACDLQQQSDTTTSSSQKKKNKGVCGCLMGYLIDEEGSCVKSPQPPPTGPTPQPSSSGEHQHHSSTSVAVGSFVGWTFFVLLLGGVCGGAYYYEKRTGGGLSSRISLFGHQTLRPWRQRNSRHGILENNSSGGGGEVPLE